MKLDTTGKLGIHCKTKRPPTLSITELAKEFGVTYSVITGHISKDKSAPKPVLKTKGTVRNTYYNPKEMREWWAKLKS